MKKGAIGALFHCLLIEIFPYLILGFLSAPREILILQPRLIAYQSVLPVTADAECGTFASQLIQRRLIDSGVVVGYLEQTNPLGDIYLAPVQAAEVLNGQTLA